MPRISLRRLLWATASLALLPLLPFGTAAAADMSTFSVTIKNVATDKTLTLPDGMTVNAPIAPGAFAIVTDDTMPFESGKPAGSGGLESLAEDGNSEALIGTLKQMKGVRVAGMFTPGQPFEITAPPGDRLFFASMFVQSNDIFFAPDPMGIGLFDGAKKPVSGDLTKDVALWDAGTEVNEAPGAGPNQAPRQKAANTGAAESGVVQPVKDVKDGFTYPSVADVVQVTLAVQ